MNRIATHATRAALAALAAITLLASGCSWAFSRPPKRTHRAYAYGSSAPGAVDYHSGALGHEPLCRPQYVTPVIDLWQAVGGGILTLYALGNASGSDADTLLLIAAVTGGVSALFGASAHYGFKQARACRELRAELASGGVRRDRDPANSTVPANGTAPAHGVHVPPPIWIAPGAATDEGITIEQDVDVDDNQIEVRTRIRPGAPPRAAAPAPSAPPRR